MVFPGADLLGAIRPDEWNLPLFIHVLSAFTLIGAVTLAAISLAAAWNRDSAAMTQLGLRALLWAALPAWVAMRLTAQWIADKENLADSDAAWINIGFMTAEPSLLLLLIATACAGSGLRRVASGGSARTLDRVATVLVSISLLAYLVAIWAMTTKPV